jgi:hypothetical protein
MGFLGVWIGSYIIKNMNVFLKFLKKVDKCNTFEGGKKIQFGVVEKRLCCLNYFLNLWAIRAASKKHRK